MYLVYKSWNLREKRNMISVIVPVYKVEKYLDECVESIINQTYTDIEVILVDDGSPDNCPQMCDAWEKKNKRIKVIHQKNGGISAARNAALDIACGEYIYFVDSDDFIEATALEYLHKLIVEYNVPMVIGGYRIISADGEYDQKVLPDGNIEVTVLDEYKLWELTAHNMAGVVVWSKLYKAELWKDCRFPIGKIHEDNGVMLEILPKCHRVVYSNKPIYNYRINLQGIMHTKFSIKNLDNCISFNEQCSYFRARGWNELEIVYWNFGSQLWCDGVNKLRGLSSEDRHKLQELYIMYRDRIREIELGSNNYKMILKRWMFIHMPRLYCRIHKIVAKSY